MKKYILANPTGNITALVTEPCDQCDYIAQATLIFSKEPTVEQVGFLRDGDDEADIILDMAGGEFCGNGTLSAAAYYALTSKCSRPEIIVKSSGIDKPVHVLIKKEESHFIGTLNMPLPENVGTYKEMPFIDFGGIKHLIYPTENIDKRAAKKLIHEYCSELSATALGIMFWDEKKKYMKPLVYVPDIDSLYWEHGCASGTCALGAYYAYKEKKNINLDVRQPGGTINISASYADNKITELKLTGTVIF